MCGLQLSLFRVCKRAARRISLRGYLPTTLSSFPMSYPFQGESDRDGPEVVVCGDRPPWSLLNATLTLDVQGASSTWTTRAELFGAINLIGSDTALLLTPFDGLPEDFAAVQTSEMLRLCRQIGVRPQGYSWFALEDWSRPLQRAQTLDEDCPAEDRSFIGFLDGGPGRARLAGRVVVPALPFVVHGVRFEKVYQPNSNCRDTVAARVDVFRSATTIPPENPRIDRSSRRWRAPRDQRPDGRGDLYRTPHRDGRRAAVCCGRVWWPKRHRAHVLALAARCPPTR